MEKAEEVTYNIEASLMNVQRGDVMVIRFPEEENLDERKREVIAKNIREMLTVNGVDIPVIILPYKWDVIMVEKDEVELYDEEEGEEDGSL